MDNGEKIEKLEKRITELHKIYANDINESFREGQQTHMMIDQYTEQLKRLKQQQNSTAKGTEKENKKYLLVNTTDSSITRKFQLVNANPDPSKGLISLNSPLGKQLSKAKPRNRIQIGEEIFVLQN